MISLKRSSVMSASTLSSIFRRSLTLTQPLSSIFTLTFFAPCRKIHRTFFETSTISFWSFRFLLPVIFCCSCSLSTAKSLASFTSSTPTLTLHAQRSNGTLSALLPIWILRPLSLVRNFLSSRIRSGGPGGTTATSTTQVSGQAATAALCKQYRRRLSNVNQCSSGSKSSYPVFGSTKGRPVASSRSLTRHRTTSILGKGASRSQSLSCFAASPSARRTLRTSGATSAMSLPSWNTCFIFLCEKRMSNGDTYCKAPRLRTSSLCGSLGEA
mmetsp:Transcript_24223/g.45957  ORF Transcript_24223/g.45957 Transcript_24223/m.45957 type:complete len:270 (+) Transcript_24223:878-1687(+)